MANQHHILRDPKPESTDPGEIRREEVLPSLRMTQTEFAQRLSVSRLTVSEIPHEKRPIAPEMAIRFGWQLGHGVVISLRI